jgi:hypothetical protein
MDLILLENESQVRDCEKRFKKLEDTRIVALSPFAMYELDKRKLQHRIIEDFYGQERFYRLGIANFKKVEQLCNILDRHIFEANPLIKEKGLRPSFFGFYSLKILYDALSLRVFQLSSMFGAEKPKRVFVYATEKYPFGLSASAPYVAFDNRESVYSRLLSLGGWGPEIEPLSSPHQTLTEGSQAQPQLKNKLKSLVLRYPILSGFFADVKRRGLLESLKGAFGPPGASPILLFGGGYNWNECEEEFRKRGIGPMIRMRDDIEYWAEQDRNEGRGADCLLQGLSADKEFRNLFIQNNVDFFPLAEERLRFLIERTVPACLKAYSFTSEMLKRRRIKAMLASTFITPTVHSAATAAHNNDIPVVSWQHGNYGQFDHPIIVYNDIMEPDTHFVFGEGVAEKYKGQAKKHKTRIIPMGSTSLDSLRDAKPKAPIAKPQGKKTVLYVTTNFYQNNLYTSFYPPFSDNLFWRTQKAILDTLAKHEDYAVIVKTYENPIYMETPLRAYAKEMGFGNCRFVRDECWFTDLLPLADVIVIDFPSTTLLESLTTSKPIFVCTAHLRIDKPAERILKRRAFCYSNIERFTRTLDRYLTTGASEKTDLDDREFLKMYGTHIDDGKSAARAADYVKNILTR